MPTHVLTLQCPDRPGIVASISEGLLLLGANIVKHAEGRVFLLGDRTVVFS